MMHNNGSLFAIAILGIVILTGAGGMLGEQLSQPGDTTVVSQDPPFETEIALDQPVEHVWEALTRKGLVDQYYVAPISRDMTKVGDEFIFGSPDNKMIAGTVLNYQRPRVLQYSFRFTKPKGQPVSDNTIVSYILRPHGEGTLLRVQHRGFDRTSQAYVDISSGWPVVLERLQEIVGSK